MTSFAVSLVIGCNLRLLVIWTHYVQVFCFNYSGQFMFVSVVSIRMPYFHYSLMGIVKTQVVYPLPESFFNDGSDATHRGSHNLWGIY